MRKLFLFCTLVTPAFAVDCPPNVEAWEEWRAGQAQELAKRLKPAFASARNPDDDLRAYYTELRETLRTCKKPTKQVEECLKPMNSHINVFFSLFPAGSFPMISNFEKVEAKDEIPKALRSPEFLKQMAQVKTLDQKELAGIYRYLKSISPNSQMAAFEGNSFSGQAVNHKRFVVEVSEPLRTWALYAHVFDPRSDEPKLRVATIQERKNSKGEVWLAFGGDWNLDSSFHYQGPANGCFTCHRSGPVPIRPDTQVSAVMAKEIQGLNRSMLSSKASFADGELAQSLGPSVGGKNPLRSWNRHYIRACSKGLFTNEEDASRVETALNRCTECHGKNGMPKVTPLWNGLVDRYVLHGHMPPDMNPPLTADERKALRSCLEYDYLETYADRNGVMRPGIFQQSLTQVACGEEMEAQAAPASRPRSTETH